MLARAMTTPNKPTGHDGRAIYIAGIHAFVPAEPLRYLRTHVCVAYVVCRHCGSVEGVPCLGSKGRWILSTHIKRREAYAALVEKQA